MDNGIPAVALAPDTQVFAETAVTPRAKARLIEYVRGRHVALPQHVALELIDEPVLIDVPSMAFYACGMLRWRERYLAVINLNSLLMGDPTWVHEPSRYVLVVAYQIAPHAPLEYGAFTLASLPQTIEVGDEMQCPLPVDSDLWPLIAISCFRFGDQPVPVIDCAPVFATAHV